MVILSNDMTTTGGGEVDDGPFELLGDAGARFHELLG